MTTSGSVCVLALIFCSPVHAGYLDMFSGVLGSSSGESTSGSKQMSMPEFAGLLQSRLGQHGHKHSPWKAQAEMFLGLLQGMGSQVPAEKANETRHYVDEIIKLLTNSSNTTYEDAMNTKTSTDLEIGYAFGNLSQEETLANQALETTTTSDGQLSTCYEELATVQGTHAVHCGEKELPAACVRKNNTRAHRFSVAKKDTWKCNFTASQTPSTCTAPESPLKVDLAAKKVALLNAYGLWKLENRSCQDNLTSERELCSSTNDTYQTKIGSCRQKYFDASDHLCSFRTKVDTWEHYLRDLREAQSRAPTLLPPKKTEWLDINLIICMLKSFRNRQAMTFQQSDYSTCETEAGNLQWVGEINTKETETTQLTTSSRYDTECLKVSFTGGLAEKYKGAPGSQITFFAKTKSDNAEEIAFTTDGSDGCTQTNAAVVKTVCREGEPVW